MISKDSLSGLVTRLIPSTRSEWRSIRSKYFSPDCRIKGLCARSSRRLFRWLKEKGVTVVITGERGDGALTRYGMKEYVSDCVISLDHRVADQVTTRRVRVVKYRGSTHGTNEYPFLIEKDGISIWPITSSHLAYSATDERIPTGIDRLDTMLGSKGFYRGSSILVSGTAGTGKTSLAATFAEATCRGGERDASTFRLRNPPAS